jgi:hypothetical protein
VARAASSYAGKEGVEVNLCVDEAKRRKEWRKAGLAGVTMKQGEKPVTGARQ